MLVSTPNCITSHYLAMPHRTCCSCRKHYHQNLRLGKLWCLSLRRTLWKVIWVIISIAVMAGSKGDKHSNRKGKSKYNKSDTITKVSQTSEVHPDRPRDSDEMYAEARVNFALSANESSYTVNELEQFLYVKLDLLYTIVKDRLLQSNYSEAEVELAILHAGSIQGEIDILGSVCRNVIAFIERKAEPRTEAFRDSAELYRCALETMVDSVKKNHGKERRTSLWHLLVKNWGFVPSTSTISRQRSGNKSSIWFHGSYVSSGLSRNEDTGALDPSSAEKVGLLERIDLTPEVISYLIMNILILTDATQREIEDSAIRQQTFSYVTAKPTEVPNIVSSDFLNSLSNCSYGVCLMECLRFNSDDPKTALIIHLVKHLRDLHEKVKEQKQWAQKKVRDSARKLSKDLLELKLLRMEEFNAELIKHEKIYAGKSCMLMLMEAGQGLRQTAFTATCLTNTVKRLDGENAQMRADIKAIKLTASENEKKLGEVLKREMKCMKRLADLEKQSSIFWSQSEEQKQMMMQLELKLLEAEKELFEAEMEWRHEITEKENMHALLAEEMKKVETQKESSRSELLKLKQKVDTESEVARDNLQRLENDLARLRIYNQIPDMFPEDESFWCDSAESSGASALNGSSEEIIRHWTCMMCLENDVSIVFLPCTHQVVCSPCYSENFKAVGGCCPYCHVKIEESIKVYGPSS